MARTFSPFVHPVFLSPFTLSSFYKSLSLFHPLPFLRFTNSSVSLCRSFLLRCSSDNLFVRRSSSLASFSCLVSLFLCLLDGRSSLAFVLSILLANRRHAPAIRIPVERETHSHRARCTLAANASRITRFRLIETA